MSRTNRCMSLIRVRQEISDSPLFVLSLFIPVVFVARLINCVFHAAKCAFCAVTCALRAAKCALRADHQTF